MKLLDVPNGIYTSPEISSIGRSERELTEAKIPYEVGHSQFKSLARAQITGRAIGMLKLLLSSRDVGDFGRPLFWSECVGDRAHRSSDHEATAAS